ncbi:MAG: Fur family transcriptional regulator [Staphylococcus epidermidis]|nr:Fur family transcriptional regulator [Staphylococcus epidermidis]
MNTNDAIKVLKENGLKYTDKRKDMLDIFVKEDKYLNAKHIQQQMDKDYPGISGEMKFRIACTNHHHHHFICENCGETKVIDFCPIEKIKSQLPNVNIHTHKLEVYGICEECQRKAN